MENVSLNRMIEHKENLEKKNLFEREEKRRNRMSFIQMLNMKCFDLIFFFFS